MILYTRQEDTQKMKIVDEYFGCDVFSTSAMQRYLPHAVYKQMMDVMEKGKELPKELADVVAKTGRWIKGLLIIHTGSSQ